MENDLKNGIGAKVKIALIGAGGWGEQHARILSGHEAVDFCAIVGRSLEKTRKRAERYNTRFYLNIQEMLEKEQPDLVHLCLPNQGHFEATLEVIRAGYPLFVEKPIVFEVSEADLLLNEAAERNLFFGINFNHRYAKPMQLAKSAIDQGRLGKLVFAAWRFGGEGDGDHPFANLIETQCHGFDSLEYLMGPVDSVMAEMTDITGKGFSTMAVSLHFANGAVGSLVGTYDSSYAYPATQRLELNGTAGRILMEDTVKQFQFQQTGLETAEVWQAGYFNDRNREFHRTFDEHFEDMLRSFRSGHKPPVPASAGRRALQLAQACVESYRMGKRIGV